MAGAYLFVAGVNYAATVYDTQDLSAVRGASVTLLEAPRWLERELRRRLGARQVETIRTGASEGLYLVRGLTPDEIAEEARWLLRGRGRLPMGELQAAWRLPLRHLSFAVGAAAASDPEDPQAFGRETRQAIAAARRNQLGSLTVPVPEVGIAACEQQRLQAAATAPPRGLPERTPLSESFWHRHLFGRRQRRAFYRRELTWRPAGAAAGVRPQDDIATASGLLLTDSLTDIVDPAGLDLADAAVLPPSVAGKIAVLHFDGNGFGELFNGLALAGERRLSADLTERRQALLAGLLANFRRDDPQGMWRAGSEGPELRFETLLWGGEEMTFVCPAWAALRLMALIQEALADKSWTVTVNAAEQRLTHGGGMLICDRKLPIRLARRLAETLADAAKDEGKARDGTPSGTRADWRNTFQLMALEGVDAPAESLGELRCRLFGLPEAGQGGAFTFDGATWPALHRDLIARIGTLARGQVYAAMEEGFRARESPDPTAWEEWRKRAVLGLRPEGVRRRADLPPEGPDPLDAVTLRLPGTDELVKLAHLVTLWDYIDPFARGAP